MILAVHALVETLQRLLNAHGLLAIRIIEHHAHRLVTGVAHRLHPRVLFRDVVAVRRGVAPLDFQSVAAHQTIHAEKFWPFAMRVRHAHRAALRELLFEAENRCLLKERAGVFVEKPSLVLINVNELSLFLRNAEHAINQIMRAVVLLHFGDALVHAALQLGSVTVGQCSDFVFHGFDDNKINSGVNRPCQAN